MVEFMLQEGIADTVLCLREQGASKSVLIVVVFSSRKGVRS